MEKMPTPENDCRAQSADLGECYETFKEPKQAETKSGDTTEKRRLGYLDYYYEMLNSLGNRIVTWRKRQGFETGWSSIWRNICLVVSEIGELTEGLRNLDPTDLRLLISGMEPKTFTSAAVQNIQEEIADIMIRMLDLAYSCKIDLADVIAKKMAFNETRPFKHGRSC
jgi:NTP pyrophosphatase (non-canonical NTP hydrolase)